MVVGYSSAVYLTRRICEDLAIIFFIVTKLQNIEHAISFTVLCVGAEYKQCS